MYDEVKVNGAGSEEAGGMMQEFEKVRIEKSDLCF